MGPFGNTIFEKKNNNSGSYQKDRYAKKWVLGRCVIRCGQGSAFRVDTKSKKIKNR